VRRDIGNTSSMYAKAFEDLNFDMSPLLLYGKDSVEPFSFRKQTYYHVALTSNEGAFDLDFIS
jgi:orotidine-5'-phosphate decarboxylase